MLSLVENELVEKFQPKHEDSILLADSYDRLGFDSRSVRCRNCGSFLSFALPVADDGSVDQHGKLVEANFCRDRLCPMCSWRRSYKIFGQVSQIMDVIQNDYAFVFLTLTVSNCAPEDLSSTIDRMYKAWSRLIRQKPFKAAVRGFFRALEVTRNPITGYYHPHFHNALAVDRSYFNNNRVYLNHDQWLNMWRSAYGDDSITQVDIRKVRSKNGRSDLGSAVAEIAKYAVKSTDYLYPEDSRLSDDIVFTLLDALHGRRLCHFGGIMAAVHKQLKLDDAEDGDLVFVDGRLRSDLNYIIARYGWGVGCYQLISYELMEGGELDV